MEMVFSKILGMSISASWLVLAVLILRLLLKRSPKWILVALWGLVALRLICPFSIESTASLIPERATEQMVESIAGGYYGDAVIHSQGSANYEAAVAAGVTPSVGDDGYHYVLTQKEDPTKPVQTVAVFYGQIWVAGIAGMLLHALVSYLRLKRKVDASIDVGNSVYICDYINTPFILGIIKPKIYLPSSMEPDAASHVLSHERSHIARCDHWWKPFGYLLLSIYWFNPLLWLAYILLCRDIELACDEKVIRDMEVPQKKAYSEALLSCSVNRRYVAACPLAFGEVGVKERVKTVLNYKKPAFWIVLVAILALIVTAVCFLTDPVQKEDITYRVEEIAYRNPILSYYMTEEEAPMFQLTQDNTLRVKEDKGEWTELGRFSPIKPSDLNFDTLFFGLEQGQSWEGAYEAWLLTLPPEETANGTKFYLLLRQEGGLYLGEGMAFTNMYPLQENIADATWNVNWLYRLREDDSTQTGESNSPYTWTSTLEVWDIRKAWSYQDGERLLTNTIEGSALDTLTGLFRGIREEEIHHREISGQEDPYWVIQAPSVNILCEDGTDVHLRYVDDTVMIGADTASGLWETKGYWVIENEAVKEWMHSLSLGGTDMLSKENRDEIRQLLRFASVHFFDPYEYNGLLFVGCYYDGGRGIGVAVYEPLADGYRLLKLIRGDEVKRCASGTEVYYCDYQDMRIFLILNQSITGMEWAGAYEASYALDTHPGLLVEYFPENLNAMYRFLYGGENSTMYMDWNNQTHGQPPEYAPDPFADLDDAYSICSNLRLNQVGMIWAQAILEPDPYHLQGFVTELSREQMIEFLNLLRSIPETAYEQAQFPEEGAYSLEVFVFDVPTYPWISLKRYEDAVYFQFHSDAQTVHQSWKINSAELCGYIDHFFVGDLSQWDRFAPYPKMEGKISCKFGNVEIVVPKYAGFEYEVTDAGLRFKPKAESGWVLLQYLDAPYAPEDSDLKLFSGIHFNYQSIRGCYEGTEAWTFVDITIPDGENEHHILFLNEDSASWVEAYDRDIGWLLDVNEMEIRVNG